MDRSRKRLVYGPSSKPAHAQRQILVRVLLGSVTFVPPAERLPDVFWRGDSRARRGVYVSRIVELRRAGVASVSKGVRCAVLPNDPSGTPERPIAVDAFRANEPDGR